MKNLALVYHSQTGNTKALADAALRGIERSIREAEIDVQVRYLRASEAGAEELRWAQGLILATPENFGYMSGALKDFFDRTFYQVEGELQPLPYLLLVSAGNDGSGAVRSIARIVGGYPLIEVQPPLIAQGAVTQAHLARAEELGATLAVGLDAGIY